MVSRGIGVRTPSTTDSHLTDCHLQRDETVPSNRGEQPRDLAPTCAGTGISRNGLRHNIPRASPQSLPGSADGSPIASSLPRNRTTRTEPATPTLPPLRPSPLRPAAPGET